MATGGRGGLARRKRHPRKKEPGKEQGGEQKK